VPSEEQVHAAAEQSGECVDIKVAGREGFVSEFREERSEHKFRLKKEKE